MIRQDETRIRDPRSGQAGTPVLGIILMILVACLIGATIYLFLQLDTMRTDMMAQLQTQSEQIAQLQGNVDRTQTVVQSEVEQIRNTTQERLSRVRNEVGQIAEAKAAAVEQGLSTKIEQQGESAQRAISEVGGQLQNLEAETKTGLTNLEGSVETVATGVAQNKEELEKAVENLQAVRGDLGVQSGLIATNSGELDALKRLGQRNYAEFDLTKTSTPQKVGPVRVRLRSTSTKKNKYDIDLYVDDKRIQKKDKGLLEPVQFYMAGYRQAAEIVVQSIGKNQIKGYLATPLPQPRGGATTTASAN